jgi:hypothetical protein
MSTAMTDFMYSSSVANMGSGNRQPVINKEMTSYPAPNNYSSRKNDKVADPQVRQRGKIQVKKAPPKEFVPRKLKDRAEDYYDEKRIYKTSTMPQIIHPGEDDEGTIKKVDVQNVYTLGMADRNKKPESDLPGPGSHEIKGTVGTSHALYMGKPPKDTKADRDQTGPNSYNIVIKSRAPKHSFGSRPGITLLNKGQYKSMRPGPGAYESKDTQFKKPTTKFSKAAKQSLAKVNGVPGPDRYKAREINIESDKYSFPRAGRIDDSGKAPNQKSPGPGEYETLNNLPRGQAKTMLGGSLDPPQIKDNGVPGPGNYFESDITGDEKYNHVPTVKIMEKPDRFKQPKEDEDLSKKLKDDKIINTHQTVPGFSIGRGVRDPISSKFDTPGPNAYNIADEGKGQFRFHMGMRTNYKANRGQDAPGPGEYLRDLYEQIGPTHLIGTGQRSDLGVGKAYLAPGPGQYNVRGKNEGPEIKFGNEVKSTKIKKTYEPGPGTYDLPSTVGNIPRYLRLKNEKEEMERLADDKSEDLELL